jgi:hypothetical protein
MAGRSKPWDRQEKETEPAFHAFVVYRDMGAERSLTAAAIEAGYSRQQMADFSRKYDWVARVRAWVRRQDQAKTRSELGEIEKMHRRHVRLALQLQDVTALDLERLIARKEREIERDEDGNIASANELAKVADRAVRIERLARGEVTERVETTWDLSRLSVKDLRELKRLRALMGSEGETDGGDEDEA